MKDLQKEQRKVLNVIRSTILFLMMFLIFSCKAVRSDLVDDMYDLQRYKSKTGFSGVIVNAFDDETKTRLPALIYVNGVMFLMRFDQESKVIPQVIYISQNNDYSLEVSYLTMHTVKVKEFHLKSGDSIVINANLKADNSPIICK